MGSYHSHETYYSTYRESERYKAKFDSPHVGEGTSRFAFKGSLEGEGPWNGKPCVVKVLKRYIAADFNDVVPDIAASKKSREFAERFNSEAIPKLELSTGLRYKKIEFLNPIITRIVDVSHYKLLGLFSTGRDISQVIPGEYVTVEPFLGRTYTKYNSNTGYTDETYQLMQTFSHWTYDTSNQTLMVCDLQGVEEESKFTLTDPAVHSVRQSYGMTDLGTIGMASVLAKHNCSKLCTFLNLEHSAVLLNTLQANPRVTVRNTTYRFQL